MRSFIKIMFFAEVLRQLVRRIVFEYGDPVLVSISNINVDKQERFFVKPFWIFCLPAGRGIFPLSL